MSERRLSFPQLLGVVTGAVLWSGCGAASDAGPEALADILASADLSIDPDAPEPGVSDASDDTAESALADARGDAAHVDALAPEDATAEDATAEDAEIGVAADSAEAPDDVASGADTASDGPWRSALYPGDWRPGFAVDGRALHDFSWAGYRNGAALPPPIALDALPHHDVVTFGADPTGVADSTAAVMAAIAAASLDARVDQSPVTAPRAVVRFPAGLFRIDGRLEVATSGVWLVGAGSARSRLYFTQTEGMSFAAHLRLAGRLASGPGLLLAADAPARATEVEIADASSLGVGDDVTLGWVITPEFVEAHGMTGIWGAFNGQWQPFFRRRVVAIDTQRVPHRVSLDVPLRYPARVRDTASVHEDAGLLRECGLSGLGVANAGHADTAWTLDQVHAVALEYAADCVIRDVESFPSPGATAPLLGVHPHLLSGGVLVAYSRRVTVSDGRMAEAQNRGTGGNGYLYEVRQSGEILFRDLEARGGRHNFIQNWGFGATGIVWLRVRSSGGRAYPSQQSPLWNVGRSEFHHSLAMANLIDACWSDDGWAAWNRQKESSGAGHSATESVFWNISGPGGVGSYQFGHGYVIGTAPETTVTTTRPADLDPALYELVDPLSTWFRTEPWDFVEGAGDGARLEPASLYEDQLVRRRGRDGGGP